MFRVFLFAALASFAWSDDKIINGDTVTNIADVPFQVSMQFSGNHFCGGSLIGTRYIMSAAHCNIYNYGVNAVLGTVSLYSPNVVQSIQYWYNHPYYNSRNFDYDFSLVILPRDLSLNSQVWPITMAYGEAHGTAVTSGWGMTHHSDSNSGATTLQRVSVPLVSQAACSVSFPGQITSSMQCAGGDGRGACKGDSGGPLVIYTSDGKLYLVGNTSWGPVPCDVNKPSMWSKNIYALEWLYSMGIPLYDWN